MTNNHVSRRLVAILAADVVGYSSMMASDEAGTLDTLKSYRRAVFNPTVAEYKGRMIKLICDGTEPKEFECEPAMADFLQGERCAASILKPYGYPGLGHFLTTKTCPIMMRMRLNSCGGASSRCSGRSIKGGNRR